MSRRSTVEHSLCLPSQGTERPFLPVKQFVPTDGEYDQSILYMPGFAEAHWHSYKTRRRMAEQGMANICPELLPGDNPKTIAFELLDSEYFQTVQPNARSMVTHSNGIRSLTALTQEEIDMLYEKVNNITVCNGPIHSSVSVTRQACRYALTYVRAIREGNVMDIVRDAPIVARWALHPKFWREVMNTKRELNTLIAKEGDDFAGLEGLVETFGASINFVVDPDDVLCPPDDLCQWLDDVKKRLPEDPDWHPTITEDPNGHSPNFNRPRRFALLMQMISKATQSIRERQKTLQEAGVSMLRRMSAD